jgi:amino acid adenylation domain-containing protein
LNHVACTNVVAEACGNAPDRVICLFEAQAERTPAAIALEHGARRVTYRELNENANLLAYRLIRAGAKAEICVGLYMEGGPGLIAAMLAVWKAGAAFVTFDVNLPPHRLAMLCEKVNLLLLLTSKDLRPRLAQLDRPSLAVEDVQTDNGAANPNIPVFAQNLAYLIFTSGTTGVPKAVAIEHASLTNLMRWTKQAICPTALDRGAQIVAPGFDAIFLEIWPYLLAGGTICFPDRLHRQSPEHLQRWLLAHRISVIMAPTPLGEALLVLDWPANCPLRLMIVGGDRLRKYPDPSLPFQLLNAYGPTENTVVSTSMIVPTTPGSILPSIGRPITGQAAVILDEHAMPVPIGSIGELYLIGQGLARGFHGDPALTAASFVPCPFSRAPGARMFRTGDFARYTQDGDIQFVGRKDRQVKILGHRVDLGEIEACLLDHPAIDDVAVVTEELPDKQHYIVAYVAGPRKLTESIPAFAASRLPWYMCPSAYYIVPRVPTTENGKPDTRSLQKMVERAPDPAELSPDAQHLAGIFRDLLGVSSIGPGSDFFACGGHSLLTARLVRAISREFGVNITIGEVYRHSRLAELAGVIAARRATCRAQPEVLPDCIVPLQTSGSSPAFFCVAPAGGSPLCYRKLANCLHEDQRFFGLQSQGLGDSRKPQTSIEDIAATYVAAIRQVQPRGPYHIGGWSFGAIVAWEIAIQLADLGQQVEQLALLDGWVGPPRYTSRGAALLESGAIAAMCLRFLRQMKLPRCYDDVRELAQWVGIGLPSSLAHLRQATWKMRAGMLRGIATEAGRSFRVFKANAKAALRYHPRPYLGGCVLYRTGLHGEIQRSDPVVKEMQLLTGGALEVVTLHGTHMSLMMEEAHIARLAAALGAQLRTAPAEVRGAAVCMVNGGT